MFVLYSVSKSLRVHVSFGVVVPRDAFTYTLDAFRSVAVAVGTVDVKMFETRRLEVWWSSRSKGSRSGPGLARWPAPSAAPPADAAVSQACRFPTARVRSPCVFGLL